MRFVLSSDALAPTHCTETARCFFGELFSLSILSFVRYGRT